MLFCENAIGLAECRDPCTSWCEIYSWQQLHTGIRDPDTCSQHLSLLYDTVFFRMPFLEALQ